jgi:hypothetical protein
MSIRSLRIGLFVLFLAVTILPFGGAFTHSINEDIPDTYYGYLPVVVGPPSFEIQNTWVESEEGIRFNTYQPGASIQFFATGISRGQTEPVNLLWNQTGPCGTQVYTDTISLGSGTWTYSLPTTAPECLGQHTATIQISNNIYTSSLATNFHVNAAGVVLSDKHGFDRCNMPSIEDMQTWWDSSPYYVANVYLGGISYDNTSGCSNNNVDANWIQSVADQGWSYLLAWVGPQAPCSGYTYRMSYDPTISYQQGREEADMALITASNVGLPNSIQIHYDVEGYGNATNTACRNTVASFIQGWTDRLHELGAKAAAYGSPCNSHISDWAANNPAPDNVWIAYWKYTYYNPFATVWDIPCLSNDLWANHERARQYAGDHTETWGGLRLGIDSNVLDGGVVTLGITSTITLTSQLSPMQYDDIPKIQDIGLISPDQGWVLAESRLLITQDVGATWDDLTPQGITEILDVHFLDISRGWLVYRDSLGLGLLQTSDGGVSWQSVPLPLLEDEFAAADLMFTDALTGKLVLKLPTSSVFNLTKEFITQDGGQTWQGGELAFLPIGSEEVSAPVANMPEGFIALTLADSQTAWVLTQRGTCQGDKVPVGKTAHPDADPWLCRLQPQLLMTRDGGSTWSEIELP